MKFTVLGKPEVTSSEPAVIVIVLAIPNVEVADNLREVQFRVILYKLAIPDNSDVPVKVAVPADAGKVPPTSNKDDIEKLALVTILPVILSVLNAIVVVPVIAFEVPTISIMPSAAEKEPGTAKLPLIVKDVLVVTEPLMVRSLNTRLSPLINLEDPVMVINPPDK